MPQISPKYLCLALGTIVLLFTSVYIGYHLMHYPEAKGARESLDADIAMAREGLAKMGATSVFAFFAREMGKRRADPIDRDSFEKQPVDKDANSLGDAEEGTAAPEVLKERVILKARRRLNKDGQPKVKKTAISFDAKAPEATPANTFAFNAGAPFAFNFAKPVKAAAPMPQVDLFKQKEESKEEEKPVEEEEEEAKPVEKPVISGFHFGQNQPTDKKPDYSFAFGTGDFKFKPPAAWNTEKKEEAKEEEKPASPEKPKAKAPIVAVATGEEGEKAMASERAKCYAIGESGQWVELGTGTLKVNKAEEGEGGRLVFRRERTGVLVLNAPITASLSLGDREGNFVQLALVNYAAAVPMPGDDDKKEEKKEEGEKEADKKKDNLPKSYLLRFPKGPATGNVKTALQTILDSMTKDEKKEEEKKE
ncbi:hypothetical protein KIPB_001497 [Kipferlia bialata]|uniref:RanBD1 domain-containing protein n=1 Tax=Kipferlia bialata TaxID=797122 RepID=A0A9K3CQX3_9EUKA|nr:hypothetical protein KIPB_001497 [Kipferlia bialata]|eukprot:g1497.t1